MSDIYQFQKIIHSHRRGDRWTDKELREICDCSSGYLCDFQADADGRLGFQCPINHSFRMERSQFVRWMMQEHCGNSTMGPCPSCNKKRRVNTDSYSDDHFDRMHQEAEFAKVKDSIIIDESEIESDTESETESDADFVVSDDHLSEDEGNSDSDEHFSEDEEASDSDEHLSEDEEGSDSNEHLSEYEKVGNDNEQKTSIKRFRRLISKREYSESDDSAINSEEDVEEIEQVEKINEINEINKIHEVCEVQIPKLFCSKKRILEDDDDQISESNLSSDELPTLDECWNLSGKRIKMA
jgi:hypothetical protein